MKAVAFLAAAGAILLLGAACARAQVAGATAAQPPAVADPNNPSPYGQMGSDQTVWAHLLVDQLEARVGSGGADLRWETQGWVGTDDWKLWVRDEGERTSEGRVQDGQLEAFVGKPISTYWNVLVGGRYDLDSGPGRGWAAVGIEGLAPRFFNVSATAYAGAKGLAHGKLELSYDQLITNRLILAAGGRTRRLQRGRSGPQDRQRFLRCRCGPAASLRSHTQIRALHRRRMAAELRPHGRPQSRRRGRHTERHSVRSRRSRAGL